MIDDQLTALAREYAEELSPDNKVAREMIELDCLGFLDRVLNSYCLVEKKDVEAKYQEAKERYFNPDDEIEKTMYGGRMSMLEYLFPDRGKEVENG